jgi:outer membrane protein TolC
MAARNIAAACTAALWVLVVAPVVQAQDVANAAAPLELSEVLRSLRRTHPSLEEAKQMVLAAEGEALATEGAFDPKAKLGAKGQPAGRYSKGQIDAYLTQLTPWWGASFFGGWRRSFGSFAVYDGDLETLSGGEFSTGFELPLWRGGPIDDMRARLRQAEFDVMRARERRQLVNLLLENGAARAYWDWVEAGQHRRIQQRLLQVAEARVEGIARRIIEGDAAEIVAVDNQRMVLGRRAKVVAAQQKLEQAAVKLSLYLRDRRGEPLRVAPERLPSGFPASAPPGPSQLLRHIRAGKQRRPDVHMLALAEKRQALEVDLRNNQVAPSVNLQGWMAKDIGGGDEDLRPLDLGVGVTIELPLLLRKERGKLAAARAKRSAARQKTRLGRDKVEAEIRVAYAAVDATHQAMALARDQRIAAERVAQAERRKLALGQSELLTVNLRELSAAKAATREVEAKAEYQRALADYFTAAGQLPGR